MTWVGESADPTEFKKGFEATVSRGPDKSRIIDTGCGLMGFHRLAIMGLTCAGMQPFELDESFVVCNGELYGFEAQREALKEKGYAFKSGSDCEIILPLWFEYGTRMFGPSRPATTIRADTLSPIRTFPMRISSAATTLKRPAAKSGKSS